jgi:hypothetical protein
MVSFNCKTKDINDCMIRLHAVHRNKHYRTLTFLVEITLTDGHVTLAIPGAVFGFDCKTKGTAKATMPFNKLHSILEHHNIDQLLVEFYDEALRFGITKVAAKTTFFTNDKILRTIHLPNNYTEMDLILLKNNNYTKEELEFNSLTGPIQAAERKIYYHIRRAALYLKPYGIRPKEIKLLLMDKLNIQLDLDTKDPKYLISNLKSIDL